MMALLPWHSMAQRKGNTEYYFGFNLMPNHTGDLITFGIVHVRDSAIVGSTPLDRAKWVRMVAGEEMSLANQKLENLFVKNKIDSCWVLYDAEYYKYGKKKYVGYECSPLKNLWKIRYQAHPYEYGATGWSMKPYAPNGTQLAFLRRFYGVGSVSQFFYGDDMFRLLKDMGDPEWKDFYANGDLTWTPLNADGGSEEDEDENEGEGDETPEEEED